MGDQQTHGTAKKTLLIIGGQSLLRKQLVDDLRGTEFEVRLLDSAEHASCLNLSTQKIDVAINLEYLHSKSASLDKLNAVNIEQPLALAHSLYAAGLQKYINVTTTHILDGLHSSFYVKTRNELAEKLANTYGKSVVNLYRAVPHNQDKVAGRFSFINRLPAYFRRPLIRIFQSFVATSRTDLVSNEIFSALNSAPICEITVTDNKNRDTLFSFSKRFTDVSFSLFVVLFFWWLMISIWLAIRLTSTGPGLFLQQRVGQNGRVFKCVKFRTMTINTKNVGTHEIDQSAVTAVGKFLRRTKLDELPQIWNLLRGEMSLIGPRPCLPNQQDLITERNKRNVLSIRPGITGLAQIHNIDMSTPELLAKWDERYLKLRSIMLDLTILRLTFLGRGQGDKTKGR